MPINKNIILSLLLVILWVCLIFVMSGMNTNESNNKSKSTVNKVVEATMETTNDLGITDKHPSENKMKQVIEKLNEPLRKVAHASEFCILAILIYMCLKAFNIKKHKIIIFSILCSFLYACTDEYHQSFVQGRTSQFTDVLIDTAGAVIGVLFINFIFYLINKKKHPELKDDKIIDAN